MYRLEFLTSLPPPLHKKKRIKTDAKGSVWLSNCLAQRSNWHVFLWATWNPDEHRALTARDDSHAFRSRAAIHDSDAVTCLKSDVEARRWRTRTLSAGDTCAPSCYSGSKELTVTAFWSETASEHFCFSSIFKKKSLPFEILWKNNFIWCLTHRGGCERKYLHFPCLCDVLNTCTVI